jgi:hypothetical protein
MARTITEIKDAMLAYVAADATLAPILTSSSATAVFKAFIYMVAVSVNTLEKLFDTHEAEITANVLSQKPHTLQWYVLMAKKFQYGYALHNDDDFYDTIDESAQIIKYAAAAEVGSRVRLKLATLSGVDMTALSDLQIAAARQYLALVKDAGVPLDVTTNGPDSLHYALTVYYDALVLDDLGRRLDGTDDTPIITAIKAFLNALPFNGVLVKNALNAAVQAVPGVVAFEVSVAQAAYGSLPYADVAAAYTPDAGYIALDETYFVSNTTYAPMTPL